MKESHLAPLAGRSNQSWPAGDAMRRGARQGPAKLRGSFVRSPWPPPTPRPRWRAAARNAGRPCMRRSLVPLPSGRTRSTTSRSGRTLPALTPTPRGIVSRFTASDHECLALALAPCYSFCVGDVAAHGRIFAYDRPSCHSIAPEMFCRT
jgi:hypothetical protein